MKVDFPFRIFEPYLSDEKVTDLNYNGTDLWIDHLEKGRFISKDKISEEKVFQACIRFSNLVNEHFNLQSPILEADFEDIRVSILHPSISGKLSVSLRKTPATMRLNRKKLLDENYISESALNLLVACVKHNYNIMVSGLPGAGKTELIKYLTSFINPTNRVISIEDSRELHYDKLHPERDSVSLKVSEDFTYDMAIKASMRQRPNWLLVSEVRGEEVEDLLKSISTGTHLLSTIHAKKAADIPKRMLYMMGNIDKSSETFLKQLYDAIDLGVHVEHVVSDQGVYRYVREIVIFGEDDALVLYHHKRKRQIDDKVFEILGVSECSH
ncbi:MAG TPA: CpaF/VirB11 family protein [Erysipelothrix sp.]|nr:CpaF/VirB11 family protein [Erysipelothrix sp.]